MLEWTKEHYATLTNNFYDVCFIIEKWFYEVNRRCKLKALPKGEFEESEQEI